MDVINDPHLISLDNSNFNMAIRAKTSDPELVADFRRYFRVVFLFEKQFYDQTTITTTESLELEGDFCGEDGFYLTEEERKTYDFT
jgi:hypothetical protein